MHKYSTLSASSGNEADYGIFDYIFSSDSVHAKGTTVGAATFTDQAHHQVVADVAGRGYYTLELSSLADRTITSSISVTDSARGGNAVSLDTDRDLTPILTVDVANPAHVTFTISGLEGGEHGTVAFADVASREAVVKVGSNGSYTADLPALATGKVTYLLKEVDR